MGKTTNSFLNAEVVLSKHKDPIIDIYSKDYRNKKKSMIMNVDQIKQALNLQPTHYLLPNLRFPQN